MLKYLRKQQLRFKVGPGAFQDFQIQAYKFLCRTIAYKSGMYNKLKKITQNYLFLGELTRLTPESSCFRNPIPQYRSNKKSDHKFSACVRRNMTCSQSQILHIHLYMKGNCDNNVIRIQKSWSEYKKSKKGMATNPNSMLWFCLRMLQILGEKVI